MQENLGIDIKSQQSSSNEMENSNMKNVRNFVSLSIWFSFSKIRFQKESFEATAIQMRSMEDEIGKLTEELKRLQQIGELEKKTNAQLEVQVSELKEKLSGKQTQQELEVNVEIAELNRKIKELQTQLDDIGKEYQKKMEESKKEQGERNRQIDWKVFKKFLLKKTLVNVRK